MFRPRHPRSPFEMMRRERPSEMASTERAHFKIALPVSLKQDLEHAAVNNRRSLSAEIIERLQTSLIPAQPQAPGAASASVVDASVIESIVQRTVAETLRTLLTAGADAIKDPNGSHR